MDLSRNYSFTILLKKIVNWDSVTPAHATTRVSRVLLTTTPSSQQSAVNCRSFQDGGFRNETEEKFKEFYLFCLVKRKVLSLRVITMKTSGFILAFALMWRYFVRRTNGGKSSYSTSFLHLSLFHIVFHSSSLWSITIVVRKRETCTGYFFFTSSLCLIPLEWSFSKGTFYIAPCEMLLLRAVYNVAKS